MRRRAGRFGLGRRGCVSCRPSSCTPGKSLPSSLPRRRCHVIAATPCQSLTQAELVRVSHGAEVARQERSAAEAEMKELKDRIANETTILNRKLWKRNLPQYKYL